MLNTTVTAIICITVLAGIALCMGVDGAFLATALAAISGLGGYQIHATRVQKKQDQIQ